LLNFSMIEVFGRVLSISGRNPTIVQIADFSLSLERTRKN
jgi:hypothetical protein